MAIKRAYGVPLASISTFRMGGTAREVAAVETEADLIELFNTMPAEQKWFIVGGGSNVVFPDGDCNTLLIRLDLNYIRPMAVTDTVQIAVGGGTPWDDVVAYAVGRGLSGIEALSWIPGTTGATPVQNVGAYGVEIKDVLISLRAFNIETKEIEVFSRERCAFGYRDSFFKNKGKGKYIITEITLALSHDDPDVPQYPGVAEYFAEHGIRRPTLVDIRNAIIAIRTKKLPNPSEVASVGSFFKNAFVPLAEAGRLKADFPTLAVFPVDDTTAKVGTGSLIDTLGWKGKRIGNFSLYKGNAMVVVNEGGGTRKELVEFITLIQKAVFEKYGIAIEPEPELLDF